MIIYFSNILIIATLKDFFNPTIINKLLGEVLTSSTCSLCISILCISEKIIVSHVIIGTMYGTGLLLVTSLIINGYHNYLVYHLCKYWISRSETAFKYQRTKIKGL
jgi:hypothetical protein